MADQSLPGSENAAPVKSGRERSLEALRQHQIKPGHSGNPSGKNGREGAEAWRKFLDKADPAEPGFESRRAVLFETLYQKAKAAKANHLQLAIEQDQGKARQSVDHTSSDGSMSPAEDPLRARLRAEIAAVVEDSESSQPNVSNDGGDEK